MRILVVGNSYPLERAEQSAIASHFLAHMCAALVARGAEVRVLTPGLTAISGVQAGRIIVHSFPWSGIAGTALSNLKLMNPKGIFGAFSLFWNGRRAAREIAADFKPDVVFAAFALPSGYFARVASHTARAPYAVWCLGSDIHTWAKIAGFRQLTRRVLRGSYQNYADGFTLGDEVTALAARPTKFLATSIPIVVQPPAVIGAPLGRKLRFLYAGRFERVKGLDVLLAAWRLALARGIAEVAELWIAGQGQGLSDEVNAFVNDAAVKDSIRLLGPQAHSELVKRYLDVDVVVIPSRRESIPVVLSEAIQSGRPVITTDAGDMRSLVERFGLGVVVPCEAPAALADALLGGARAGLAFHGEKYREFLAMMDIGTSASVFLEDAKRALTTCKRDR